MPVQLQAPANIVWPLGLQFQTESDYIIHNGHCHVDGMACFKFYGCHIVDMYSSYISLDSKFWPWSSDRSSVELHSVETTHEPTSWWLTTSWLLVGIARKNLVKTKTSSFPSLAVSFFVKSMARISRGQLARRWPEVVWDTGACYTAHSCQCSLWPLRTYQANTHEVSAVSWFICSPGDPSCHEELLWHQAEGCWAEPAAGGHHIAGLSVIKNPVPQEQMWMLLH